MTNIDFFGCSFTEFLEYPYEIPKGIIDLQLYSMHSHNTKTLSSFLEFDLAYNKNSNYVVNNYGKGSFGNFTICNVIENKIKKLDKNEFVEYRIFVSIITIIEKKYKLPKIANIFINKKPISKDNKDSYRYSLYLEYGVDYEILRQAQQRANETEQHN